MHLSDEFGSIEIVKIYIGNQVCSLKLFAVGNNSDVLFGNDSSLL